ncbi:hypothetical protein N7481_007206 [Penicillium waksmanii]|uniref:uncharacterized protein n=1 Tax=Penicillium waksmanii TaxID=69791 RepID=UPI0025491C90|nr:uncharacterized protein N7481_007206 [Penicillium waksmanii]KAJ5979908.1 hypothetical protein N7481_007206 [Penicillium waksmanii]
MRSTPSALHSQGQKLYQKGDFKAAISAFTEALKQKDADSVGILDNRAATYCKLEQYDQARRDAKHMIKQAKEDERGYLRCAKVLLLEAKPDKALEIYAYGLKVLPNGHPRRETMEQLHKKLEDRMNLNRKDPFTMLPLEIAALVIQHFSFKNIVGILRVCKSWERFFGNMRELWMKIDLSGARQKVPWTAVRAYIRRSRGLLTHATFKNLALPSTPKSIEFLSRCPRLEHLELWVNHDFKDIFRRFKGCKSLKNFILSAEVSVPHSCLEKLLTQFPKLERIELWSVKHSPLTIGEGNWPQSLPNLRSITLATQQAVSTAPPTALVIPNLDHSLTDIPNYPNLQELRLDWEPPVYRPWLFFPPDDANEDPPIQFPPLKRLELNGLTIGSNFCSILPTSIEYLSLKGGSSRSTANFFDTQKLEKLSTLMLKDAGWVNVTTATFMICGTQAPLRVLHIDECFNLSDGCFMEVLRYASEHNPEVFNLTELSLVQMQGFDDSFMNRVCVQFPKLKVLNLSKTRITGCTIRDLADARSNESSELPSLDRLCVRGCESVSSDAVTYGRERGLDVIT